MNNKQAYILDYLAKHVVPIVPDGTAKGAEAHAMTIKAAVRTADVLWRTAESFCGEDDDSDDKEQSPASSLGELLDKLKKSGRTSATIGVKMGEAGSVSELKDILRSQGLPTDMIDTGFKEGNCGLEYGEFISEALQARGGKVHMMSTGSGCINIEIEIDGVFLQLQVKQREAKT